MEYWNIIFYVINFLVKLYQYLQYIFLSFNFERSNVKFWKFSKTEWLLLNIFAFVLSMNTQYGRM